MPSTSTFSRRPRIVAAPMTLLMPGAGPPPTRIPSFFPELTRTPLLFPQIVIHPSGKRHSRDRPVGVYTRTREAPQVPPDIRRGIGRAVAIPCAGLRNHGELLLSQGGTRM